MKLTHIDESGHARMVDVSDKAVTSRCAVAKGCILLQESTIDAIRKNRIEKGDVLAAARIAGIMAAKRCDEIIPLCHRLALCSVKIEFDLCNENTRADISAEVRCNSQTGAEMEALTAVSVAALTIYDMVKAIDKSAVIGDIKLMEKSGGKSGHYIRKENLCVE